MDSLVAQVRSLAQNADAVERNKLWETLEEVRRDTEPPMDLFLKLFNSVSANAPLFQCLALAKFVHSHVQHLCHRQHNEQNQVLTHLPVHSICKFLPYM